VRCGPISHERSTEVRLSSLRCDKEHQSALDLRFKRRHVLQSMVRFCTEKYRKPTPSNFNNLYAHLTNYSLNKGNFSYVHSLSLMDQASGSKRLLSTVFGQMAKCGLRTKKLWHDIKIIIVKTVLAMLPELMINYEHEFSGVVGPQCF
ncbi:hypothetical protein OSTOST_07014, partial [Ostertagia ostertagi]